MLFKIKIEESRERDNDRGRSRDLEEKPTWSNSGDRRPMNSQSKSRSRCLRHGRPEQTLALFTMPNVEARTTGDGNELTGLVGWQPKGDKGKFCLNPYSSSPRGDKGEP